jgi:predicted permease
MHEAFEDVLAAATEHSRLHLVSAGLRSVSACAAGGLAERIAATFRAHPRHHPTLFRDVRFAVRSLRRRPGFTAIAVLTLALGIGANTAIYSVVQGVLLSPLPYTDPDGLVMVWATSERSSEMRGSMSWPDVADIGALDTFETLIGYRSEESALTGLGEARMIGTASVMDGLLATFRQAPALGRDITAADTQPNAARVAVVAHGFWQTALGGRADVLGSTIEVAGRTHEIVGVAPPDFSFPEGTQLWRPHTRSEGCERGCHDLRAIGRLVAGSDVASAHLQTHALALRLAEAYPESNINKRFRVISLTEEVVGDVRAGLLLLLGAVGVVLLIACANLANLLLVRAAHRRGEVALRAALGASKGRLVREILAESVVLALAGGTVGLAVAAGLLRGLRGIAPPTLPRLDAVALDGRILLFTLTLSLTVAVAFGLSPALRLARGALRDAMMGTGKGVNHSPGDSRYRASLLAGEVALSALLLVGAGLLLRTFGAMTNVPLGFDGERVVRFTLSLPSSRYSELERIDGFFRELEFRIAALPDVESVGSIFGAAFARGQAITDVIIEGRPEPGPGEETEAALRPVTADYLETMHIPVLSGRGLELTDRIASRPVAVVNEAFVRENFPGEDPLGRRFSLTVDFGFGEPTYEIVGVAGDVRASSVTAAPRAEAYVPLAYVGVRNMVVHVRARGRAPSLIGQLRTEVARLDPNLPLARVESMQEAVDRTMSATRFYLILMGGFAVLAVLLAAVGLYGVVSYQVARQTREIGVRIALGARTSGILAMVISGGLRPAVAGVVLGLGGALAAGQVMESLLFQVRPRDPLTLTAVPVLLLCVVAVASLIPAWRATRVDPVTALRGE